MRSASVLLLLTALGCAPEKAPPLIEAVDVPATVTQDPATGEYPVPVKIMFHDEDDAVNAIRVTLPSIGMTYEEPLSPPVLSGTVALTLRFPSNIAKGPQEIDVSLVDASKLESVVAKETVTLQ